MAQPHPQVGEGLMIQQRFGELLYSMVLVALMNQCIANWHSTQGTSAAGLVLCLLPPVQLKCPADSLTDLWASRFAETRGGVDVMSSHQPHVHTFSQQKFPFEPPFHHSLKGLCTLHLPSKSNAAFDLVL